MQSAPWAENAIQNRRQEDIMKRYNAQNAKNAGNTPPDSPTDYSEKPSGKHIDNDSDNVPATPYNTQASRPAMVPPELVAAMSPERRVEAENQLRRKIDYRLMPMVVIMYIMNYLDRNNIAAARLGGLEEDLGLKGTEYQVSYLEILLHCHEGDVHCHGNMEEEHDDRAKNAERHI